MLARPVFKPHFDCGIVPGEGVFLLSGGKQTVLRGRLYELVVPHLIGRTVDEICDHLNAEASAAEVYFTLAQLEKKGCLTEIDQRQTPEERAWWSFQNVDPAIVSQRLTERSIAVKGIGLDVEPLRELLEETGARVESDGEWIVVVTDHYLRPEIAEINQHALAANRPWLIVKPFGAQLWLGPLFQPGRTGCWNCLSERLRSNRAVESYLRDQQALTQTSMLDRAGTVATRHTAWGIIAHAITSWVAHGELPDCDGKVRTFNQLNWQSQSHSLVRLPYCSACSDRTQDQRVASRNGHHSNGHQATSHRLDDDVASFSNVAFRPLSLQSCKKTQIRDGGHRVVSPEETLRRFGHHVSSITGAISALERTSGENNGAMHVYAAGQNLSRRHHSLGHLKGDLRNMSAGKGMTDAQAKASGLCEGLERHSGIFRGDEPRKKARLCDLGGAGIDPRSCLLFSEAQYRDREITNQGPSWFSFVPVPFDPKIPIDWSPVWSLTKSEVRYLPTSFCYYDFPCPDEERFCVACSNGNAAGNTIEEAVLQGFFELVERDSVALWWYNRVRRPGVDLGSFQEPYFDKLSECLEGHHREFAVLDLTSDLGIPVFAAWSRRKNGAPSSGLGPEQIIMGFGAHLDAKIALLRAVTEMNQMLSYLLESPSETVNRDQITDEETVHWLKTATLENKPYLVPDPQSPSRVAMDYKPSSNDDVTQDVRDCQALVEQQGLEMLVLDQTRSEIGLPVAKVIVPGLRHFWARFAPGRLYDVPVKSGWLQQPLTEEQLNPIPMFL